MHANRFTRSWTVGALLECTAATAQAAIVVADKKWLQPAEFTDRSWNDIASICNPTTGLCNGALNGTDITGYQWARRTAVWDLFVVCGVTGTPYYAFEFFSAWAPAFQSDFTPTEDTLLLPVVEGWASTLAQPDLGYRASISDYTGLGAPGVPPD
jgi:hypothetical protein